MSSVTCACVQLFFSVENLEMVTTGKCGAIISDY